MTNSAETLQFDITDVPFSRRESNLVFSSWPRDQPEQAELLLRHIFAEEKTPVFALEPMVDGRAVRGKLTATPGRLRIEADGGVIEIIMPDPNVIRLRGEGIGLRLREPRQGGKAWSLLIPAGPGRWRSIIGSCKLLFTPIAGDIAVTAPWQPKPGQRHRHHGTSPMIADMASEDGRWELALHGYESEIDPPDITEPFDQAAQRVEQDFARWRDACPPAPKRYAGARELAAYISWSSVVPASGNFFAPAMLMSKNWMTNTWNWDNYFNAWASTYRDPDFAWDQFLLHIRHQHETGALGDAINQQKIGWSYTKPPVHGWMLERMMHISDRIDDHRLAEVYPPLVRWTEWWCRYRDDDGDGICQYHHGNDSGWDDATAFDVGSPNEAPDLNALLVIQMDVLGQIADRLAKPEEAEAWRGRSTRLLKALIDHSWRDGQFVSMVSGTHEYRSPGDSLLNFIPLVLGRRLPDAILDQMVEGLTRPGRFLTEWGLATEAVDSPEFLNTGYWRGAIWPPPMMMIIDGLRNAGRTELAEDLAERFCRLVDTHGFGENHDPLSGVAHYDPAYTWSTSVFQILAADYLADS